MAVITSCLKGRNTLYQTIGTEAEFVDSGRFRVFFLRNHVMSDGRCLFVLEIGSQCFERVNIGRLVISRNVEVLGECCFGLVMMRFFASEHNSHLRYFEPDAFAFVKSFTFLCIPGDSALCWF
jgi:hypothetical protein